MEGNLRFKINWASLTVGSKVTVFALYLMAIFQVQAPWGLIVGGAIQQRVFCITSLGGLYLEGLIFRILRYLRSLILIQIIPKERTPRIAKLTDAMTSLDSMT